MSQYYDYAVIYTVDAVCQTPMRSGNAEGDIEAVLLDADGSAMLQGSSLAGALRSYLEKSRAQEEVEALFGKEDIGSSVIVSDGIFSEKTELGSRPRLKIDAKTGTTENKFDILYLHKGSKFSFTLTWLGTQEPERQKELVMIEEALSALNRGEIRLGAQKTNGFGRVSIQVYKSQFDLMQEKDRKSWLEAPEKGKKISLSDKWVQPAVQFVVEGRADSILVKGAAVSMAEQGGRKADQEHKKKEVTVNIEDQGQAILPGSSIKGAVRGQTVRIADALGISQDWVNSLFGRGVMREEDDSDNGVAGKAIFEDVQLQPCKQQISRIRINKFTGGVMRGALFTEEPLSSPVAFTVTVQEPKPELCGLLLFALRDLGLGLYTLGSGVSIGRGYVQVEKIKIQDEAGKTASLTFDVNRKCHMKDPDAVMQRWLQALGGEK